MINSQFCFQKTEMSPTEHGRNGNGVRWKIEMHVRRRQALAAEDKVADAAGEAKARRDAGAAARLTANALRTELETLAKIKGVAPETMADATNENFFRLFSKVPRPAGFQKAA